MVSPDFLLDTSAIRAIRFDDLRVVAKNAQLAVSPISILEFLCHIDEHSKKETNSEVLSRLHKANLLKCRLLELLDDPYAEQAEEVGAKKLVNPNRFEDRLVLPLLFPALEAATTLEEFYGQHVSYPTGEEGAIRDVANRARLELDKEEKRYIENVTNICQLMLKHFGFEYSQQLKPDDFIKLTFLEAYNLANYYEEGVHLERDMLEPVFSSIYPNIGYGIVRAVEYLRRANGRIEALNIDPNDMEDSLLCLHLSLDKPRVLVTGDKGTLHALRHSLKNLALASKKHQQPSFILTEVIETSEFIQRFLPK